jgi:hypothetical protein
MVLISSCGSGQVEELKEVTARGLGEGLSDFLQGDNLLCEKPVLECERPELAEAYIVRKSCDLLNAKCSPDEAEMLALSGKKGFFAKFACKAAIKIVLPAVMPSRQLPSYLKDEAKCKASCLDDLAGDYSGKICEAL